MTRTLVAVALALLAAACLGPVSETSTGADSIAVLGPSYDLHARAYVMLDPGAPESGPEAVAHYERFVQKNNEALQYDIQRTLGQTVALGAPAPAFLARDGDRLVYDFDLRVALSGTDVSRERGLVWDASGTSFDVLRRLHTNEGLVEDSHLPAPDLPYLLHTTSTTPYGFDRMAVKLSTRDDSDDAWPDYSGLFEDGVLDIGVHFGVVREDGEQNMRAPRAFLDWLRGQGYVRARNAPSSMTGDPTSGPWVRTIQTPRGPVVVQVRVVFGRAWMPSDPTSRAATQLLADRVRESLAARDVVVFIGHDYGDDSFWTVGLVGNHEPIGIPRAELRTLPLSGRSQLIVSEGCGTAVLAETLRQNPSSNGGARLDLLASATMAFIDSDHAARSTLELVASTNEHGEHVPRRYLATLLAMQLEHPIEGAQESVRLVDFLDDNPRRHPYVDPSLLGRSCVESSECGIGAACLPVGGAKLCTPECGSAAGCEAGRACRWDPATERPNVQNDPRTPRYCLEPVSPRT